ncbi:MAG: hypothetical protein WD423_10370 [Rhodothermales bacterium]
MRRAAHLPKSVKPTVTRTAVCLLLAALLTGCGSTRSISDSAAALEPLEYVVDLNDLSGDSFKVTLAVDDLDASNAVYQFAATAPGTYQVMDIGRYVRSFEAVDADGNVIPSERISTNQWRIGDPESVAQIRYAVAETWDTPVDEHPIYRMAGTSLEEDHALFNNQAVFGFPAGMQQRPVRIRLDQPEPWVAGTALETDDTGYYLAEDYDHLVDSPILTGRLSVASTEVSGGDVGIYTYSATDRVESDEILESVHSILTAAGTYLGELPVDRYTFLFHFEDQNVGALEHSYSSTYALAENTFDQMIDAAIPDIVAHEFLHVVTPLNIHSEVIEQFNFVEPTPSEHVWLYEGVTEWMSHASQLRAGLIDESEYLDRMSGKLRNNDQYDPDFSLSDIGLHSFSEKGQQEWGNIYQRGAVVAELLNIRLLALSDGRRGLREVVLELSEEYGPNRPFDERTFFDAFTAMTYPEIGPFLDAYVRGTQELPVEETFGLIGVDYVAEENTGETVVLLGVRFGVDGDRLVLASVEGAAAECGFQQGDVLVSFDDETVTVRNAQQVIGGLQAMGPDEPFTMTVLGDDGEQTIPCAKQEIDRIERHVLRIDPDAPDEAEALRWAWSSRL